MTLIRLSIVRRCFFWYNKPPDQSTNAFYHGEHHERQKKRVREYNRRRRECPDYKEAERVDARERKRRVYADPEGRRQSAEYIRRWRAANPDRYAEYKAYKGSSAKRAHYNMARYLRQLRATPPWVNLRGIQPFYEEAARRTKETGIRYSVDHIM